jgi:hypothetical protein
MSQQEIVDAVLRLRDNRRVTDASSSLDTLPPIWGYLQYSTGAAGVMIIIYSYSTGQTKPSAKNAILYNILGDRSTSIIRQ